MNFYENFYKFLWTVSRISTKISMNFYESFYEFLGKFALVIVFSQSACLLLDNCFWLLTTDLHFKEKESRIRFIVTKWKSRLGEMNITTSISENISCKLPNGNLYKINHLYMYIAIVLHCSRFSDIHIQEFQDIVIYKQLTWWPVATGLRKLSWRLINCCSNNACFDTIR